MALIFSVIELTAVNLYNLILILSIRQYCYCFDKAYSDLSIQKNVFFPLSLVFWELKCLRRYTGSFDKFLVQEVVHLETQEPHPL